VCLIVVVTTVVEVPVPRVYVRVVSSDGLGLEVTAGPLPVPRGTDGVAAAPALLWDERIAELADDASATGQMV